MKKSFLIAIDGPSASGKGTVAKKLALHFKVPYLNTGALYRLIAYRALLAKIDLQAIDSHIDGLVANITEEALEEDALFTEETGAAASVVAKNQNLRDKIFHFQRDFALSGVRDLGGAVLDGRDIGTVICPDAPYKFFITADVEIRAKRRFDQLKKQAKVVSYDEILAQLKKRDEQDSNRANSPLTIAKDAIVIDNGNLTIEEGFQKILNYITNDHKTIT